MLKRLIFSLAATKSYNNKITKHMLSSKPKIPARSFHSNPSYRSNCDFGSPCQCRECSENAKRPICEICHVHPTVTQSSERSSDRKGISSYSFTSFCAQCWTKDVERKRSEQMARERMLALRKEKMEKMMGCVRKLHSREQVPIKYAVERFETDIRSVRGFGNSRQWFQRHLVDRLSQNLQIVKVRNRYLCNKQRVDAMNFILWFFYDTLHLDV